MESCESTGYIMECSGLVWKGQRSDGPRHQLLESTGIRLSRAMCRACGEVTLKHIHLSYCSKSRFKFAHSWSNKSHPALKKQPLHRDTSLLNPRQPFPSSIPADAVEAVMRDPCDVIPGNAGTPEFHPKQGLSPSGRPQQGPQQGQQHNQPGNCSKEVLLHI